VIACQRMIERLKGTLKNELEALKNGTPLEDGTPKKTATPRKRKGKDADANGDAEASPTKKGRRKKVSEPQVDDEEELNVKAEVEDEE
jgi:hypothetical protein